jgi:hypothetical protein
VNTIKDKKLDRAVRTPVTYISKVMSELKRGKVEEPNDLPVLSIQTDALGPKNNFMGGGNPPFFWTEVVVQLIEDMAQNITTRWMKSQSLARRRRRLMDSTIRLRLVSHKGMISLRELQSARGEELSALMLSILDQAFKADL